MSNALDLHSFSVSASRALNMSVAIMRRFSHRALTTEHLLLALVNQSDGNANKILQHFGLDLPALRSSVEQLLADAHMPLPSDAAFEADGGREIPLTAGLALVLDRARIVADGYRLAWVGTDHLLAAVVLLESPAGALLKRHNVTAPRIEQALRAINASAGRVAEGNAEIVVDLVALARGAREGSGPAWIEVVERQEPLRELVHMLLQRRRNSVTIIGEEGSGRRSLVAALAQLGARGELPRGLPATVWALQPAAYAGSIEANVEMALRVAAGAILLVPDLPLFFGASAFPGFSEAGQLFRGALMSGAAPRLIGTATPTAFAKYLEAESWLQMAGAPLHLEPPSVTETVAILDAHRPSLQRDYRVSVATDATLAAAQLARQFLPGALPATAMSVLERACVLVQLAGSPTLALRPAGVSADPTVDANDVAAAVGAMTGVPVGQLAGPERERLARMEEELHGRVIGQDEAIAAISRAYRRARAGFRDAKRPVGSFLFLGPSGVGKTETARALAEFLFGSEDAIVRVDMSEYGEKHTVARLIGAPPGYVGYEAGGQLTEQVRRKPSSVVLFDEIEKAHPDVYNLFLQVLDDGRLTDGKGRRIDFRNTMIVMTSNLGTEFILGAGMTRAGAPLGAETRDQIEEVLRGHFRPEFLNRIDKVVIFTPLSSEQLGLVLELQLARVRAMATGAGLTVELTAAAKDWLLAQNDEPEFGARPLRRIVQDHLLDALVDGLTSGRFKHGDTISVGAPSGGPLVLDVVQQGGTGIVDAPGDDGRPGERDDGVEDDLRAAATGPARGESAASS